MSGMRSVTVALCLVAAVVSQVSGDAGAATTGPMILTPDDARAGDEFGRELAVDGDTAVISSTRSAYVFLKEDDEWRQQAQLVPDPPIADDSCFGGGVAIDGDTVIVGDACDDTAGVDSGAAFVFVRDGEAWTQQAKLVTDDLYPDDIDGGEGFGGAVALSDDWAIIAVPMEEVEPGGGGAYFFERVGSTWHQRMKQEGGLDDGLFRDVVMDGDTALFPTFGFDSESTMDVYGLGGGTWSRQAIFSEPEVEIGRPMAISGNTAMLRAFSYATQQSTVRVYVRSGCQSSSCWTLQHSFASNDPSPYTLFQSAALDGDLALIGEGGDDEFGDPQPGSVHVIRRTGSTWTLVDTLAAPSPDPDDWFGGFHKTLGVSGETGLVGAKRTDTDSGIDAGVVYVYDLTTPGGSVFVSSTSSGRVDGVVFRDEDILRFDRATETWSMFFDGSKVGLGAGDINAIAIESTGPESARIHFSLETPRLLRDVGFVDDSDVVTFTGTTGPDTAGTFELLLDGSDVKLKNASEDIDAFTVTNDGYAISTLSNIVVPGVSGKDEDLTAFVPTSTGATTAGTFSVLLDGSDVMLNPEDVAGASWDPATGGFHLSMSTSYNVEGGALRGDRDDILLFTPTQLGPMTSGSYTRIFNGDDHGFGTEVIDGIHVEAAARLP